MFGKKSLEIDCLKYYKFIIHFSLILYCEINTDKDIWGCYSKPGKFERNVYMSFNVDATSVDSSFNRFISSYSRLFRRESNGVRE